MCIAKICNTLRGKHPETLRHSVLISGSNPLLIPYTPISYHPFGHPCLPPPIPHVSKRNCQSSSPTTLETDVDSDKLAKYLAPWCDVLASSYYAIFGQCFSRKTIF